MVNVSGGNMRKHEETEKICVVIAGLCRSTKDLNNMKQQSTVGFGPKHLPTSLMNFFPKGSKAVSSKCTYTFSSNVEVAKTVTACPRGQTQH